MSFDIGMKNTSTAEEVSNYEASAWEPPMAPMDMPRQQLEAAPRTANAARPGLLMRLTSFLHIA